MTGTKHPLRRSVVACAAIAGAQAAWADEALDRCLLERMQRATDTMTVAEIRASCSTDVDRVLPAPPSVPPQESVLVEREKEQDKTYVNRYAITSHYPSYLLLATYSEDPPRSDVYGTASSQREARSRKVEAKFQISFKFPVALDLPIGPYTADWQVGYTNRSFWQVYNQKFSAPFRETNHEPETWLQFPTSFNVFGLKARSVSFGLNHQSNGRTGEFSRSWNRAFAAVALDYDKVAFQLRPWWRIREDESKDDNRDIEAYMGNFDLIGVYKAGNGNTYDFMVRNNLRGHDNRGALQLGWSFPLLTHLRGYAQWFYGYGESLVDYNVKQNSVGIGIQLTDW